MFTFGLPMSSWAAMQPQLRHIGSLLSTGPAASHGTLTPAVPASARVRPAIPPELTIYLSDRYRVAAHRQAPVSYRSSLDPAIRTWWRHDHVLHFLRRSGYRGAHSSPWHPQPDALQRWRH